MLTRFLEGLVYQEKLGFDIASGFKRDSGFLFKFPAELNTARREKVACLWSHTYTSTQTRNHKLPDIVLYSQGSKCPNEDALKLGSQSVGPGPAASPSPGNFR